MSDLVAILVGILWAHTAKELVRLLRVEWRIHRLEQEEKTYQRALAEQPGEWL